MTLLQNTQCEMHTLAIIQDSWGLVIMWCRHYFETQFSAMQSVSTLQATIRFKALHLDALILNVLKKLEYENSTEVISQLDQAVTASDGFLFACWCQHWVALRSFQMQVWAKQLFSICWCWHLTVWNRVCFLKETQREGNLKKRRENNHSIHFGWEETFDAKQLLCDSLAQRECGHTFTYETVEKWPDGDNVDLFWHLDDLTEDHWLSPQIGIRYSWANGALHLLISLDPSPDHGGLFWFLSSQRRTQLTPSLHAYYSINDKHCIVWFSCMSWRRYDGDV